MIRPIIVLLLLSCFLSGSLKSQTMELGIAGGVSLYSGDLAPKEFGLYFEELYPSFGVFGRYNTGRFFSIRLGVHYAKVSGNDRNGVNPERGLNFRTDIFEATLTGEFNLFRLGYPDGLQVVPYLLGGVGVFSFDPEILFDGDYITLQPLGTEGQGLEGYGEPYQLTQLNIPVGGGLKFIINEQFTIGLEFSGRKLFTDYLDDISDTPLNYLDVLEGNGSLAATISNPLIKDPEADELNYQRGSPYKDWYYIGSVTLSYHFTTGGGNRPGRGGKELGCPTF